VNSGLLRHPIVRVVSRDGFAEFAGTAKAGRPNRVFVVSPWISPPSEFPALGKLLDYLKGRDVNVSVITQPPDVDSSHAKAVDALLAYSNVHVYQLSNVHAKIYLARLADNRFLALLGSANLTTNSTELRELNVLIFAKQRSNVARELEAAFSDMKRAAKPLRKSRE